MKKSLQTTPLSPKPTIPLSKWLPYSVARTWHTQLGIFWIATAWLATGLFVAPGSFWL